MSRAKVISPEVRSELNRLLKCAQHAHTNQDDVTEASCLLRWAELYAKAGGAPGPGAPINLTPKQAARHRTAQETPLWRVRQRLTPAVAIVRVEEIRFITKSGHENNYWLEHLSCGHTQTYFDTLDYPARSKRRRCKECGEAALIAAGYIGDLAREHEPLSGRSTATLTRSIPAGDINQFTFNAKPAPAEAPKPRVLAILKPIAPTPASTPPVSDGIVSTSDQRRRG